MQLVALGAEQLDRLKPDPQMLRDRALIEAVGCPGSFISPWNELPMSHCGAIGEYRLQRISVGHRTAADQGEQAYAISIFANAIDYTRVRVHNEKYIFFQPNDTAMTPNGEIYFPAPSYKGDFSTTITDAGWIIHELTHVWQYQHGINVRVQGVLHRTYEYGNLAQSTQSFSAYYVEQQASIVEDYFYITHGFRAMKGSGARTDYERIIPFLPRRR